MKKIAFFLLMAVALISCRAQKLDAYVDQTTDTNVTQTDSAHNETLHIQETKHETDSTSTETQKETDKEESTDIAFVPGGGTYNTQTGEATGVSGVKTSKREKELQKENTTLKRENTELNDQLQTLQDSISENNSTSQSATKSETHQKEETLNGWQRFIQGCGYAFMAIILAAIIYGAYRIYRKFTIGF
jgi:TolA-binding protein